MSSEFYHKRLFEKKRFRGERESRPKTFKTEESAKEYAKVNGIAKCTIELKGKKYYIIAQE